MFSLLSSIRASSNISPLIFSRSLIRSHINASFPKLNIRTLATSSENSPLTEQKDNKKIVSNDNSHSNKGWNNRENRQEFYSAFSALQGLAVISGVGLFFVTERQEREKRKAELGRNITKDIETIKTKLKFLMNELDDLKSRTDAWKAINLKEIKGFITLQKLNEYEEAFSLSMRMVSRYDTSLVPQVLQVEADYQNERFRRLAEVLRDEKGDLNKTKENLENLRTCFIDIYNVLNIVGLATGANTIDRNKQSAEQKLLLETLKGCKADVNGNDSGIITDEVRVIIHQFRREQLKTLDKIKAMKKIDNSSLVRNEVFKPGRPS